MFNENLFSQNILILQIKNSATLRAHFPIQQWPGEEGVAIKLLKKAIFIQWNEMTERGHLNWILIFILFFYFKYFHSLNEMVCKNVFCFLEAHFCLHLASPATHNRGVGIKFDLKRTHLLCVPAPKISIPCATVECRSVCTHHRL